MNNKSLPSTFPAANYQFTNEWFLGNVYGKGNVVDVTKTWYEVLEGRSLKNVLEIRNYEGQSTCFLIEFLGRETGNAIMCIDTWRGSFEHSNADFSKVEQRFDANTNLAQETAPFEVTLTKNKSCYSRALAEMIVMGVSFDLIYIDGSHHSMDVLSDIVMSSHILADNGLVICDDYLWDHGFKKTNNPNAIP